MRSTIIALCLLVLAGLGACNIINPTEAVPYYIKVDSVSISGSNYLKYGSTKSHRITDVWVYANNNFVGTFEVPATIPILADSGDVISIRAGINQNGASNAKKAYDLYTFSTTTINWPKNTTQTLQPVFTYLDNMTMPINWDFEGNNPLTPKTPGLDLPFNNSFSPGETYEGVASAVLDVDTNNRINQVVSNALFSVPQNKVYYLEMNYKCTMPFEVYLISNLPTGQLQTNLLSGVNIRQNWNKIYFNVGALQSTTGATSYQLLIRSTLPTDSLHGQICLDNIKLVGEN